jgi:hypothetical protein
MIMNSTKDITAASDTTNLFSSSGLSLDKLMAASVTAFNSNLYEHATPKTFLKTLTSHANRSVGFRLPDNLIIFVFNPRMSRTPRPEPPSAEELADHRARTDEAFLLYGADLPLILILVGVIGGLLTMGIIGLFIGPVVLAVGYTLLDAWIKEDDQPAAAAVEAPKAQ